MGNGSSSSGCVPADSRIEEMSVWAGTSLHWHLLQVWVRQKLSRFIIQNPVKLAVGRSDKTSRQRLVVHNNVLNKWELIAIQTPLNAPSTPTLMIWALAAPVIKKTQHLALFKTGSVMVIRFGGGFGESPIYEIHRLSSWGNGKRKQ